MARRPIAGKTTVDQGVTTVDLHVGAQTVKLTIEDARDLARALSDKAMVLHDKIWPRGKPKA
jgi:hypothetical protein